MILKLGEKGSVTVFLNIVLYCDSVSDVSDTILYLLLGTTEPAEIENAEVSFIKK